MTAMMTTTMTQAQRCDDKHYEHEHEHKHKHDDDKEDL